MRNRSERTKRAEQTRKTNRARHFSFKTAKRLLSHSRAAPLTPGGDPRARRLSIRGNSSGGGSSTRIGRRCASGPEDAREATTTRQEPPDANQRVARLGQQTGAALAAQPGLVQAAALLRLEHPAEHQRGARQDGPPDLQGVRAGRQDGEWPKFLYFHFLSQNFSFERLELQAARADRRASSTEGARQRAELIIETFE
ncbi:Hypothetical predicted protein [Olea europaea subsp. europaea]|uniref:Uncharacterized protein n=1 Tax=Olea europaea subsp. europaea TaxID=158383 RepID=A0A8S0QBK8_OLEEU|nr:Hypothetical predicted protein [Olea europaea subsp. europaea]